MERYRSAASRLKEVGGKLLSPPSFSKGRLLHAQKKLLPGESVAVALPEGNAAIRHLAIQLDPDEIKANPAALRSTVLRIRFDGKQTVWCPLGVCFCSANAINPFQTWTRAVTADGLMTCR